MEGIYIYIEREREVDAWKARDLEAETLNPKP